jgi:hypothetical protein
LEARRVNDIVPKETLVKQGSKGIGGVLGGAGILVLNAVTGAMIPGLIVGGALTVGGLGIAASSREDKVAGTVAAGAGALTVVASLPIPLLSSAAGGLMWLSGLGLVGAGVYGLIKFFKGLKSRR